MMLTTDHKVFLLHHRPLITIMMIMAAAGLGLTNRPPGKTINIDTICRGWPGGLNGESKSLFTRIWLIKNHIYIRSLSSSSSSSSYSRLNISEPAACTQSSPTWAFNGSENKMVARKRYAPHNEQNFIIREEDGWIVVFWFGGIVCEWVNYVV